MIHNTAFLEREALESCRNRGHKMGKWVAHSHNGRPFYRSVCRVCGMYVDVRPEPHPNEINIGGTAVALNCGDWEFGPLE